MRAAGFILASLLVASTGHSATSGQFSTPWAEATGPGFVYFRGNEMPQPWKLSVVDGVLCVNDSGPTEAEFGGIPFDGRVKALADSTWPSLFGAGRAAAEVVSLYRADGIDAILETGRVQSGGMPSGVVLVRVDGIHAHKGNRWKLYIHRSTAKSWSRPAAWRLVGALAEHLRAGDGLLIHDLNTYLVIPHDHVAAVQAAISGIRAGRRARAASEVSLAGAWREDIAKPAPLRWVPSHWIID